MTSSAWKQTPTGDEDVYAWMSRFDVPAFIGVYTTVTCCQVAVAVTVVDADPTDVPPLNSRTRSLKLRPGVSERTQIFAV